MTRSDAAFVYLLGCVFGGWVLVSLSIGVLP